MLRLKKTQFISPRQNLLNFVDLKDFRNLFYLKTLKFAAFSDFLDADDYKLISEVLSLQNIPVETFITIGKKPSPLGFWFYDFSDKKMLNELLNSVQFFFVGKELTLEQIILSIMTGGIPIITKEAWYLKEYGLKDFYAGSTATEINEKINKLLICPSFWRVKVARLSEKYRNKIKKL